MAAELRLRRDLGSFLNNLGLMGCGAEIGAYMGEFSREVLEQWQGCQWIAVNTWRLTPEFSVLNGGVAWDMDAALNAVTQLEQDDPRFKAHRLASTDWKDSRLFDVVYIDGAHDFQSVTEDLNHWWERLRPGGLFCGHDYLDGWRCTHDINQGVAFGVRTAVDRFAANKGRAVVATREEYPTWWFRKPCSPIEPSDIAVVSMSTRDVPWAQLAIENHQSYCDRWGYKYNHVRIENESRPVSWAKLRIVNQALKTSRFVMWMDADALFQRFDLGLHRFWDGASPFVFFKDELYGLNLGVFFARQCSEVFGFLDRWSKMTEFNDHPWWEQAAAMELERRGELIGLVMPQRLANSYPHFPGCWDSNDFVAHFAGMAYSVREALMRDFAARAPRA